MDKITIKRFLAWVGIVLILALFLYISIQSYRVIMSPRTEQSEGSEAVVATEQSAVESRVNWGEVVVLSIVGVGLIYAIRRTDSKDQS